MTRGIRAAGAYAPDLRIHRDAIGEAWGRFEGAGIESKAVPEADEDVLTMAWEAGRRALAADDRSPADVGWLGVATTTPPVEASDLTARLGSFFTIDPSVPRHQFTGSTRAGTRALFAGLDADLDESIGLVIASDAPRGSPESALEHAAGAGAAAFVIGPDAPATIAARAEYASPYPGTRFRRSGADNVEELAITPYERESFREVTGGAVDGLDADTETADAAAIQAPDGSMPYRLSGRLGIDDDAIHAVATVHELGDTGAASVPLSIASAFAAGVERLVAASFGSGAGADAIVVDSDEGVSASLDLEGTTALTYPAYLRRRGEITGDPPTGGGAMVSVPSWRRSLPQRHRLEAGSCPDCGALAFPPEGACPGCRALVDFDPVALPRTGTVAAVTTIERGGEPPEFATQQAASGSYAAALVEFEHAGNAVTIPLQVAETGTPLSIGDAVGTAIRRLYEQEGVIRYARKARPDPA